MSPLRSGSCITPYIVWVFPASGLTICENCAIVAAEDVFNGFFSDEIINFRLGAVRLEDAI